MTAMMITGTLMRNTEPHQKCSSSRPDVIGPMATPAPDTPAQMAMACVRSCAGKTLVRIDRVDGMMNAAARPMMARPAITCPDESESEAKIAPAMKSTSPNCSAPLRPKRSPRVPAVNSMPAKISA